MLQPETEIPVKLDSLGSGRGAPAVGDEVTITDRGYGEKYRERLRIRHAEQINDTDMEEILAEHGGQDEDAMMERLTKQADMGQMGMGGGREATVDVIIKYKLVNGQVVRQIVHRSAPPRRGTA